MHRTQQDLIGLITQFFGYHYLIPPKRFVVDLRYGAGLSVVAEDILSGDVNAKLKLKIFFFSKTWKKRLFSFNGIGRLDFPLFSVEGSADANIGSFPWGEIRMPSPFPRLNPIVGTFSGAGTAAVIDSQVEEFFYDSLCTCIDGSDPEEERECLRNDDCCVNTPICFSDPEIGGTNVCSTCRGAGDSCNELGDCCGGQGLRCFDDPDDATSVKHCTSCVAKADGCNEDADCCGALTCQLLSGRYQCQGTQGCFQPCGGDDDCAEFLTCISGACRNDPYCIPR